MKKFLIGIVIGIGKIMPGVSGAMLAITFKVYEDMLEAIANILKTPKKSIKYLFSIGMGILISIIFFSNIIKICLNKYYFITMSLFIGLMLGSLYNFFNSEKAKVTGKRFIIFIISFLFIFFLPILLKFKLKVNVNIIYLFFMGILDSFATIVPGVSGTALLLIFGCYNLLLNSFSNIFEIESIYTLLPFFIGFGFGVIAISKIINNLYIKNYEETFYLILGFSSASMFLLILDFFKSLQFKYLIIYIILIAFGFKIGSILDNK